ncbi:hypothetical protein ACMHYO_02620 [Allopusillimonas ginsengisoli]|uniref:hypothetical protein n=1 Tax=Allopusillimonas ginsengisoli TaxID=453575 RepID=UPI0014853CF5
MHYQIVHYLTAGKNKDLYIEWLQRLRDNTTKIAVIRRWNDWNQRGSNEKQTK